jgi:hypothetical protein
METREAVEDFWPADPMFEKQWHLFDNKLNGQNVLIGITVLFTKS